MMKIGSPLLSLILLLTYVPLAYANPTERLENTILELRQEIWNQESAIVTMSNKAERTKRFLKADALARYHWDDLMDTKEGEREARAGWGENVNTREYREKEKKALARYFNRDIGSIELTGGRSITSFSELADYIEQTPLTVIQRKTSDAAQLDKRLAVAYEELDVSKETLRRLEDRLFFLANRLALEGIWQPIGNDSQVTVKYDARRNEFVGRVTKNRFECYKVNETMFRVKPPRKGIWHVYLGEEYGFDYDDKDCRRKKIPFIQIEVKDRSMIYYSEGLTMHWFKVD